MSVSKCARDPLGSEKVISPDNDYLGSSLQET